MTKTHSLRRRKLWCKRTFVGESQSRLLYKTPYSDRPKLDVNSWIQEQVIGAKAEVCFRSITSFPFRSEERTIHVIFGFFAERITCSRPNTPWEGIRLSPFAGCSIRYSRLDPFRFSPLSGTLYIPIEWLVYYRAWVTGYRLTPNAARSQRRRFCQRSVRQTQEALDVWKSRPCFGTGPNRRS